MKFKTPEVEARFSDMHPKAQELAVYMDDYAQKNYKVELTITATVSTIEEDKELKRQSDTHRTGRAFDVRTHDLPEALIAELCSVVRRNWGKYGAMVGDQPSVIVYRPHGTGPHLHVQLNRKFIKLTNYEGKKDGTA